MGIYLKFDGIPGVGNPGHYKDWHAAASFSWGMSNEMKGGAHAGTYQRMGKINVGDINWSKTTDKNSPMFVQHCTEGKNIKKVEIHFTAGTKETDKYATLTLENVLVSSYQMSGDADSHPGETMTMSFGKYNIEFSKLDAISGKIEAGAKFNYDLIAQK
jgi:type VI secretion system Hcp family effector